MMPLDNTNLYDIRYGGMKMASQGGIPPGSNHRHHGAPYPALLGEKCPPISFLFIKECFLENSSFFAGDNIFGGQIVKVWPLPGTHPHGTEDRQSIKGCRALGGMVSKPPKELIERSLG